MDISLSSHFTYKKLIRFTLPSIYMMLFTSMYTIVDGFFVSNYVGKAALASITLIYPLISIISAIGYMFGAGGTAIIGKLLGEGRAEQAKAFFSLVIYVVFGLGALLGALGIVFLEPIARVLGAEGQILRDSSVYARVLLLFIPLSMLQYLFQSFFVVAEKPNLGFYVTLIAGITNFVLDYLFIAVLGWDIAGAALATGLGQLIGALLPVLYFVRRNSSLLRMVKPRFSAQLLFKAVTNGFSEFLTSIASSGLSVFYNYQVIRYAGENGLAAFGVIGYVDFLFISVAFGYANGVSPILSFHYGAQNHKELANVYQKSKIINLVSSLAIALLCFLSADLISSVFVGYHEELRRLTTNALRLFSIAFLLSGYNVMASTLFTALNNGLISAVISGLRQIVFGALSILVLPQLLGIDGVWLSFTMTGVLTFVVSLIFILSNRKRYYY